MAKYARNTNASSDKSRSEIEKVLQRYGATGFMYGWEGSKAVIGFKQDNWVIKFELPMPDKNSDEFRITPSGRHERSETDQLKAWEQATRQRWRALLLVIKAKLEAVESGITTFQTEFMAHVVMPNGSTFKDFALPEINKAIENRDMPVKLIGM